MNGMDVTVLVRIPTTRRMPVDVENSMDAVTVSPATVISSRLISVFHHGAFSGPDDATPATAWRKGSSGGTAAGAAGRRVNIRSRRALNTGAKYTADPSDRCLRESIGRMSAKAPSPRRRRVSVAGCAERQLEVKPLCSLQVLDHFEEIAGSRVAAWAEHPHQALRRPFCPAAQFHEPNRRVDIRAKYCLAGVKIAGEKALDAVTQKLLPVLAVRTKARLHRLLELSGQRHLTSHALCESAATRRSCFERRDRPRSSRPGATRGPDRPICDSSSDRAVDTTAPQMFQAVA